MTPLASLPPDNLKDDRLGQIDQLTKIEAKPTNIITGFHNVDSTTFEYVEIS